MRKYLILFGVGLVFVVGIVLFLPKQKDNVYTVKRQELVNEILVNGTYTTAAQTEVFSPARGIITQLYIRNSDEVKKGKPLFHVESTGTVGEQKASNTKYKTALNALQTAKNTKQKLDATMWTEQQEYLAAQNAQKYKNDHTENPDTGDDYTNLEKLSIDNAVVQAEKDFEAAEDAYKKADIAVVAAQAQVEEAQHAYEETKDTTVTAPASGTIVNLQKKVGDRVLPESFNTPVLVITDFSNPGITASINEVNIPRIKEGQKAKIVFDALPEKTFTGIVEAIDSVGIKNQGTITYNARIVVDNLIDEIKPSMTASITIEAAKKENVITAPNSALIKKNGKVYVQKVSDAKNKPTQVVLGLKGLTETEVISGLSVGDQIYLQE